MSTHLSNTDASAVDTHFHVFQAGVALPGARYVPSYDATLAMWQAQSRAAGVGRGVLVQTSFMGSDNQLLLQTLQAHRNTLRGVAVVQPEMPVAELQRLQDAGVRGIRLNLAGRSHEAGPWAGAHLLWDALAMLGWHVELHTDVGALPQVLAWLPAHLPVVLDHMGKPDQASAHDPTVQSAVHRSRACPVHVKLSGAYRLAGRDATQLARLWQSELGPTQMLWGSDWPCTNHEENAHYPPACPGPGAVGG
jgi:predicted TIM-barrel fold metal-dependent hydrolase